MKIETASSEETIILGQKLAGLLASGDIICVFGNLGAGKTHFAKGVAKGLGVADTVTSPTFTIIKEYGGRLPFYHIDAYRLEGFEELADLGYDEYLDGGGITLIEWPDRVAEALPEERLDIHLETIGDYLGKRRLFTFEPRGKRYLDLIKGMENN